MRTPFHTSDGRGFSRTVPILTETSETALSIFSRILQHVEARSEIHWADFPA